MPVIMEQIIDKYKDFLGPINTAILFFETIISDFISGSPAKETPASEEKNIGIDMGIITWKSRIPFWKTYPQNIT